jgi:hypothetical protein
MLRHIITLLSKNTFTVIIILLQIGAGIQYGMQGNHKKLTYWIAAAVINYVVTF